MAVSAVGNDAPRVQTLAALALPERGDGYAGAVRQLFGPDADPRLVIDPRAQFADALAQAEVVRFAAIGTTESVLLARFGGYIDAERAWVQYLRVTGLGKAGGKGHSQTGYVVMRPARDRLYALRRTVDRGRRTCTQVGGDQCAGHSVSHRTRSRRHDAQRHLALRRREVVRSCPRWLTE